MEKILIANRGEIALRVMRTAKEMGIKTVAVYSEADRNAPHVLYADEAIFIGASPSSQSYLSGEKIIEAAIKSGAQGIHPGYGFLSENAVFAKQVVAAGIIFIGPSPESIIMMGSKLAAKKAVKKYNVPLIPGTDKPIDSVEEGLKIADLIGYPILIKASAGGGGKGMRVVQTPGEFNNQLSRAVSEAKSAFDDGSVFLEKYVASPRHIEFQILADNYGNVVHLFERECSVQRRHQKVIEEAPCVVMTQKLREKMGSCAINVAKSCNYTGAGTVEFLMDENHNFYFLEMNTRLQVEHPVTEFITGIDLVRAQINIARGEKLSVEQNKLQIIGHAIEARIYAEDTANNFLPDTGILKQYIHPHGLGIRVDDGYTQGMEIPIYYDSMLGKLIVYADNRNNAIRKMIRAIEEFEISGVSTTLPFCEFVMKHKAFTSGAFDTNFIERYYKNPDNKTKQNKLLEIPLSILAEEVMGEQESPVESKLNKNISNWKNRRNSL